MLTRIIDWSPAPPRVRALGHWLALVLAGALAFRALPIDAFPDTTPVAGPGQRRRPGARAARGGAPAHGPHRAGPRRACRGSTELRSISKFGLSQITVQFEDGTDLWFARQQVVGAPRAGRAAGGRREALARARSRPASARSSTTWSRRRADARGAPDHPRLGDRARSSAACRASPR